MSDLGHDDRRRSQGENPLVTVSDRIVLRSDTGAWEVVISLNHLARAEQLIGRASFVRALTVESDCDVAGVPKLLDCARLEYSTLKLLCDRADDPVLWYWWMLIQFFEQGILYRYGFLTAEIRRA